MDRKPQVAQLQFTTERTSGSGSEDALLRRRVLNYLSQLMPEMDRIDIDVHQGTVVLKGTVATDSMRWRCVDCCRHVAGVLTVIDRLSDKNFPRRTYTFHRQ